MPDWRAVSPLPTSVRPTSTENAPVRVPYSPSLPSRPSNTQTHPEGIHQLVGQVRDEAHSVTQYGFPARRQQHPAQRGVQGRKQSAVRAKERQINDSQSNAEKKQQDRGGLPFADRGGLPFADRLGGTSLEINQNQQAPVDRAPGHACLPWCSLEKTG